MHTSDYCLASNRERLKFSVEAFFVDNIARLEFFQR